MGNGDEEEKPDQAELPPASSPLEGPQHSLGPRGKTLEHYKCAENVSFFLSLSLWFPMSQSLRRNNWWGLARGGSILTLLQLQWERTLNCSTRWGSRCPAPCSWGFPISLRKGRTYLSTIGSNGFHCLLFRDNLRLVGWFVVLLKEPGTLRSPFWTFYKRAFKTQQTLKTLILEHRES